ncbi:MBOAT family protein [Iamia sp.]|uniref:MBOAT family O-acyltransferase n=1 Tax=Iamia sp. TaxID=2722710 RepID=UPI002CE31C01|nr:MBOAT family protein [Iamia sp.]HXH57893.1 MBOAT family protein [Iamia sp.]
MLFPTFEYAVFFSGVFVLSWLLRPHLLAWRVFLLVASFVFYGAFEPVYCLLLAASILVNQAMAVAIHRCREEGQRRVLLGVAVVANLAGLGYFKYTDFFIESVSGVLETVGIDTGWVPLQIILPVAVSFFTFQALSYVIDTYRGDAEPSSLLDFAVYLSFFPHLVAGPIVRARELLPQLTGRADPRKVNSALAFRLIMAGLFKKVVISSFVSAAIVDDVFAVPESYRSFEILFAIYAYAIQIYADFSGYTDIAIGCALLLGLRFPQNFDAPYTATSMQGFWRRWHMTLSFWLRDYLYIPLGGNTGGRNRRDLNLFLTMLIGGFWHGAAWTFLAWGGIHGVALAGERRVLAAREAAGKVPGRWSPVIRWIVTFHIVCLGWVFFRAESFGNAFSLLWRLVAAPGIGDAVTPMLVFVIAAMIASQFVPIDVVKRAQAAFSRSVPALQAVALAVGLLLIDALGPEGVPPFIYFQF